MGYHVFEMIGNWSYTDHEGRIREVQEPCWLLQKEILIRKIRPSLSNIANIKIEREKLWFN